MNESLFPKAKDDQNDAEPPPDFKWPPLLQSPIETDAKTTLGYSTPKSEIARWSLNGSSEVIILAEKIFSQTIKRSNNAISWPATPENFSDLLMIRHRFPVRVSASAARVWGEWMSRERQRWISDQGVELIVATKIGTWFRGSLRPFQIEGVQHLLRNRKTILADEMGLGKTVQALAAGSIVNQWPQLVVAQPHVMTHWLKKSREFTKQGPDGIHVAALEGRGPKGRVEEAQIYVTHYGLLEGWKDWMTARQWGAIIADECQELRVATSQKTIAFSEIARRSDYVWGLSGTPIYNRGLEAHTILNAMAPGIMGSRTDFKTQWCTPTPEELKAMMLKGEWPKPDDVVHPDELGQYLVDRGLLLRRLETEVMAELPPLRRATKRIDHDKGIFADLIRDAADLARKAVDLEGFKRKAMEAQAKSQARKATGIAKAQACASFIRALVDSGSPTIVFAHHHDAVDILRASLHDFNPVCITGRETRIQKERAQHLFETGVSDVIIVGLRAATGIDGLQKRAKTVVFAELDWSPAVHAQGEKRAHRWGQEHEVWAYYLVSETLYDGDMMPYLVSKIRQATGILLDGEIPESQIADDERSADLILETMLERLRKIR